MISRAKEQFRALSENEGVQRFAKILGVDILVKTSSFILLPVYLLLMSAEEYGLYGYIVNVISTFSIILNFGLYLAQTSLYHDKKTQEELVFNLNLLLTALLGAALTMAYFTRADLAVIRFLMPEQTNVNQYRHLILFSVIVSVYSFMAYNYFLISNQIKYFQYQNIAKLFVINALVLSALYYFKSELVAVRLRYNLLGEFLVLIPFYFIYIRKTRFRVNTSLALRTLKIGIPGMLAAVINTIYTLTDRYVIAQYDTGENLGIYQLGTVVAGIIYLIFSSYQSSILPSFYQEKDLKKSFTDTKRTTKKFIKLLIGMSMLLYAGIAVALWIGIIESVYMKVLYILPILLTTQILLSFSTLYGNYYNYFEKNQYIALNSFISACVNLGLNLWLVPKFSIVGSALATLAVAIILSVISYRFARRQCLGK